jgi:hypothetical protein
MAAGRQRRRRLAAAGLAGAAAGAGADEHAPGRRQAASSGDADLEPGPRSATTRPRWPRTGAASRPAWAPARSGCARCTAPACVRVADLARRRGAAGRCRMDASPAWPAWCRWPTACRCCCATPTVARWRRPCRLARPGRWRAVEATRGGALCQAAGCEPAATAGLAGALHRAARFEVGADVLQAFGVDPGRPGAAGAAHFRRSTGPTAAAAGWPTCRRWPGAAAAAGVSAHHGGRLVHRGRASALLFVPARRRTSGAWPPPSPWSTEAMASRTPPPRPTRPSCAPACPGCTPPATAAAGRTAGT